MPRITDPNHPRCKAGRKFPTVRHAKGYLAIPTWRSSSAIVVIPDNAEWIDTCWIFWFGQHAPQYIMVWEKSLEGAMESCAEWLSEHAPGHLMEHGGEEHVALLKEACEDAGVSYDPDMFCGMIDDKASEVLQAAEADLTYTESGFLSSGDWGIAYENPTREDLAELVSRF